MPIRCAKLRYKTLMVRTVQDCIVTHQNILYHLTATFDIARLEEDESFKRFSLTVKEMIVDKSQLETLSSKKNNYITLIMIYSI